jgi:hypothetical protein
MEKNLPGVQQRDWSSRGVVAGNSNSSGDLNYTSQEIAELVLFWVAIQGNRYRADRSQQVR